MNRLRRFEARPSYKRIVIIVERMYILPFMTSLPQITPEFFFSILPLPKIC